MKQIFNRFRSLYAEQRGSAAIELCLMLPILAMFVLGATDIGMIVREHQLLQNAAREGARFSALPANQIGISPGATPEKIRDKVINYLAQENITITSSACSADGTVPAQWNCGAITI